MSSATSRYRLERPLQTSCARNVEVQRFSYVRISSDEEGECHFERLSATMEATEFAPPAAPLNVAPLGDASAVALVGGGDWGGETLIRQGESHRSVRQRKPE